MTAPYSAAAFEKAAPISAASEAAIRFDNVSKRYPARGGQSAVSALDGVTLDIPAGAIFGVIGPSGAGKSTLIRLVNGLEKATEGRVRLFGEDVTNRSEGQWREARRATGMIFQHFNLLSSRTVFDNIALPLEIAGAGRAAIAAKVAPLLDLVGLSDKSGRYPSELSGGQKQRVGIARALATDPRVLLCDEATSALDPETTRSILALLREINRALGVTILLITHEIPVIKEICDRVAVLENGRIVEEGDAFDVLIHPQRDITRRFVESVTGVEPPAALRAELSPDPVPGGRAVLRIGFSGPNATAPVVSRLTSVIGVDVNILAGRIDEIAGRPFGSMIVAVPGDEPARSAVEGALAALDLKVETLGHVA